MVSLYSTYVGVIMQYLCGCHQCTVCVCVDTVCVLVSLLRAYVGDITQYVDGCYYSEYKEVSIYSTVCVLLFRV